MVESETKSDGETLIEEDKGERQQRNMKCTKRQVETPPGPKIPLRKQAQRFLTREETKTYRPRLSLSLLVHSSSSGSSHLLIARADIQGLQQRAFHSQVRVLTMQWLQLPPVRLSLHGKEQTACLAPSSPQVQPEEVELPKCGLFRGSEAL